MTSFADTIEKIIEPALTDLGFEIVRISMGGGRRKLLQVMLERLDGTNISLDDCADASRAISALLDVEDPIAGNYILEVSSPGLNRPLVKLKDYVRFQGSNIQLELHDPQDNRKRFSGLLTHVEGDEISLELEEDGKPIVKFLYSGIQKAKVIPEISFKKDRKVVERQ